MSKPFYITTSIPYATSEPHIGNVMDWLYADCLRRYVEIHGTAVSDGGLGVRTGGDFDISPRESEGSVQGYSTRALAEENDKSAPEQSKVQQAAPAGSSTAVRTPREVYYNAGSDEHGSKIAEKAEEQGVSPANFVAKLSPKIEAMHESIGSHPTHFQRTDAQNHHEVAQKLWQQMAAKGDIYKGTYKGWYCTGCETFYTETEVKDNGGTCPLHNKPYVEIEEENYFFKLSAYGDKLIAAYEAGDTAVYPRSRQNEILSFVESGMQDLSISRPKSSVSWGIEVPGDEDHVMYVWFEALMNYISCLNPEFEPKARYDSSGVLTRAESGVSSGESSEAHSSAVKRESDGKMPELAVSTKGVGGSAAKQFGVLRAPEAWPPDVQVCGKDNLRFHAAIWPAMLLSLEVPLVQKLMVHGFISVEGQKMSKTIGNVVQPADVIDEWGLDAYRYFFLRHVSWADDGDYAAGKFEQAYNSELANDLGNLVGRVSNMVGKYLDGDLSAAPEVKLDTDDYHAAFAKLEINKAAGEAWRHVQSLNQYIEQNKPWQLAKQVASSMNQESSDSASGAVIPNHDLESSDSRQAQANLREVMNHLVGAMRAIAPLIEPFTPVSAGKIADVFAGDQLAQLDGVLFPKRSNK